MGRAGEGAVCYLSRVRVSVVLPYRDAASTLAEAARGVLAEDDDLELLLVDDGSRDDGPTVARALDDPRVRHLDAEGQGLVAALQRGVAAARGEAIARMDADDVWLPGRLDAQREALALAPRLGAVGCRVEAFPEAEIGEGLARYVAWQNALLTPAEHARDLFVEAPLCHPSAMIRRAALEAVGGYRDAPWAEDYDLWLRLDAAGWELAKVSRVGLRWRHHGGRASFSDPRYAPARFVEARAAFLAPRLRDRPVAMWGAGRTGRRLAAALEAHGVRVGRWIDIDPNKIGGTRRGAPIDPPQSAGRPGERLVVAVGARGARDEVRARLIGLGLTEGADFVCAA